MKKVSWTGVFVVLFFGAASAQDCSQSFYAMKEGTKYTLSHFNEKGKLQSSSESVLKSVKANGNVYEANIEATMKKENGKPMGEPRNFVVKCENGIVKMDINSMFMTDMGAPMKGMEMTISGTGISIPATLSEGQTLDSGSTEIKVGSGGMTFMTMKFDITNRKVEKKESLTVAAGTFDCYKISYDMDMKVLVKKNLHVVQWMSPGVGMVKSQNFNSKGELEGYSELTKFEK